MPETTEARTIIRNEPFAVFYSDRTILLKDVRASHPHLVTRFKDSTKFTIKTLMPRRPEYKSSSDALIREINQIIKDQKSAGLASDRKFMQDGDNLGDPLYAGHYVISAGEETQPALRGAEKDPKTNRARVLEPNEAERLIYGGSWVNCLIRPWWQDNGFGKRVNANLLAVQSVRLATVQRHFPEATDEAFGTGRISNDAIDESFGAIDDDDNGYDDAASLGEKLDL